MKELFQLAGTDCCGPLVIVLPKLSSKNDRANQSWHYYFSLSHFARDIQNHGTINALIIDGETILFTHRNNTGKKPTADAERVRFVFGRRPTERQSGISRRAALSARKRRGIEAKRPLLDQASRPLKTPPKLGSGKRLDNSN